MKLPQYLLHGGLCFPENILCFEEISRELKMPLIISTRRVGTPVCASQGRRLTRRHWHSMWGSHNCVANYKVFSALAAVGEERRTKKTDIHESALPLDSLQGGGFYF